MKERMILYRWKVPGGHFRKWTRWGLYPSKEVRDEMLVTRRAKYSWSDRFEFKAAEA